MEGREGQRDGGTEGRQSQWFDNDVGDGVGGVGGPARLLPLCTTGCAHRPPVTISICQFLKVLA